MNVDIYFRSGSDDEVHFDSLEQFDYLRIIRSDDEYYQSCRFSVHGDYNLSINDTIDVFIDNTHLFSGYVTSKKPTFLGSNIYQVTAVGKTYDLWRYALSSEAIYNGWTVDIAESIVENYTPYLFSSSASSGVQVSNLDLSDLPVGDALRRLTKIDGFRFYIEGDVCYYYNPGDISSPEFTITEEDLLKIQRWEEDDSDLFNYVIIKGSTQPMIWAEYPSSSSFLTLEPNYIYAMPLPSSEYLDQIEALKLLVRRGAAANMAPLNVSFYYTYSAVTRTQNIKYATKHNVRKRPYTDDVYELTPLSSTAQSIPSSTSCEIWADWGWAVVIKWKKPDAVAEKLGFVIYDGAYADYEDYIYEIRDVINGYPGNTIYTSGVRHYDGTSNWQWFWIGFEYPFILRSGQWYALVAIPKDGYMAYHAPRKSSTNADGSSFYRRADGSWREISGSIAYNLTAITAYPSSGYLAKNVSVDNGRAFSWHYEKIIYEEAPKAYMTFTLEDNNIARRPGITDTGSGNTGDMEYRLYLHSTDPLYSPFIKAGSYLKIYYWKDAVDYISGNTNWPWDKIEGLDYTILPESTPTEGFTDWISVSLNKLPIYTWLAVSCNYTKPGQWEIGLSPSGSLKRCSGNTWSTLYASSGLACYLSHKRDQIKVIASSQSSIDKYGKHIKTIQDASITDYNSAAVLASGLLARYAEVLPRGVLIVSGNTDYALNKKAIVYLPHYNISSQLEIRAVEHILDKGGFRTRLTLSSHEFDIARELARLKYDFYSDRRI